MCLASCLGRGKTAWVCVQFGRVHCRVVVVAGLVPGWGEVVVGEAVAVVAVDGVVVVGEEAEVEVVADVVDVVDVVVAVPVDAVVVTDVDVAE